MSGAEIPDARVFGHNSPVVHKSPSRVSSPKGPDGRSPLGQTSNRDGQGKLAGTTIHEKGGLMQENSGVEAQEQATESARKTPIEGANQIDPAIDPTPRHPPLEGPQGSRRDSSDSE